MSRVRKVTVDRLGRLPAFCHAAVVDGQVLVSGTLGTAPGGMTLVEGGVGAQTAQALRNIGEILSACGCGFEDVAKVQVYLTDMGAFAEMNAAYLEVMGDEPPARITVGCSGLALGASVEIDCVAFVP